MSRLLLIVFLLLYCPTTTFLACLYDVSKSSSPTPQFPRYGPEIQSTLHKMFACISITFFSTEYLTWRSAAYQADRRRTSWRGSSWWWYAWLCYWVRQWARAGSLPVTAGTRHSSQPSARWSAAVCISPGVELWSPVAPHQTRRWPAAAAAPWLSPPQTLLCSP